MMVKKRVIKQCNKCGNVQEVRYQNFIEEVKEAVNGEGGKKCDKRQKTL